jgi:hypothetical protein
MDQESSIDNHKPPFFKSWRPFYALVIGALILQIIVFYAITRYFE